MFNVDPDSMFNVDPDNVTMAFSTEEKCGHFIHD